MSDSEFYMLEPSLERNPFIKKIDGVLKVFAEHQEKHYKNDIYTLLYVKKGIELTNYELEEILKKLSDDGYILVEVDIVSGSALNLYHISYDGLMFDYLLGYYGEAWAKYRDWHNARNQEKENASLLAQQVKMIDQQLTIMKEQTVVQKSVKRLTTWIAFGTIVAAIYYTIEIFKHKPQ